MNKNLYVKPEIEVIEIEIEASIMTGSIRESLDSSRRYDGDFD